MKYLLFVLLSLVAFSCTEDVKHDLRIQYKLPFNGVLTEGETKDVVLRVREIEGLEYNTPVNITVESSTSYTLSFDPTQTIAQNPTQIVTNSNWVTNLSGSTLSITKPAGFTASEEEFISVKVTAVQVDPFAQILTSYLDNEDINAQNDTTKINIVSI